jgi:two-component system cell cycle response regulator DivK
MNVGSSTRILLVEDDPQNMYLARFLLERAGYEVESVTDGATAVHRALDGESQLVLMDILLPELDGLEATRRIRARVARPVIIVALTALSMKGDKEAILDAGCDGYISKPIDPDVFVSQVERFLQSGKA